MWCCGAVMSRLSASARLLIHCEEHLAIDAVRQMWMRSDVLVFCESFDIA